MKVRSYHIPIITAMLLFALCATRMAQAQNTNEQCPPNTDQIPIYRAAHLINPGVQPHTLILSFSEGMTFDPFEGEEITNYLAGVLEGEMGGTDETELQDWRREAALAISVAARTAAYYWCGRYPDYLGVTDSLPQHYWPGHASARAEEYREFVTQTSGQYLTYNGNIFSLQYRKYVGQQTEDGDDGLPHKSVKDPVGSPNEVGTVVNQVGMGFHSANHWARGLHNTVGCEGGLNVGCDGTLDVDDWRLNPVWDHWQILAHYYSKVDFQNFPNYVPPDHRWNMLSTSLNSPADNPVTLETGTTRPVTIQLQNSSFVSFTNNNQRRKHVLLYSWIPCTTLHPLCPDSTSHPEQEAQSFAPGHATSPILSGEENIPVPLQSADDTTLTIALSTPDFAGDYILRWDIQREENDGSGKWVTTTFGANGWPEQEQFFKVRLFPYHYYLPMMTKQ